MKLARLFAILLPFFALAGTLRGATSSSDSGNTQVDTRGDLPAITVTMHRARPEDNVLENPVPTTSIDEALRVKGSALAALSPESVLQGGVDPRISFSDPSGGLVADGVTPLLFKITAMGISLPVDGTTYELAVKEAGFATFSGTESLNTLLKIVKDGIVRPETTFRLTPSQTSVYAVFGPVNPERLNPTLLFHNMADLEVRELGLTKRVAVLRFGIRKPPVALVHGYNVTNANWGPAYASALADRAGFVVPVGYGLTNDSNTLGSLSVLAGMLDEELRTQIERAPSFRNWAFTRYDAVGHSQGGVLLRMLCSQNVGSAGFVPFRNNDNFQRGRFRRVVTIGSPHAGSAIAEMGIQLRNRGIPFGSGLANFTDNHLRDLDRLFQSKFQVGAGSRLDEINNTLQCDGAARLHLLRTTIYNGDAPGENGEGGNPQYYQALYLNRQTPAVNGQRPGLVVAPNGSDGVVDSDNQEAGAGGNHTSAITGENIIHAGPPILPEVSDTRSSKVAQRVKTLLDGAASEFGPVTIPDTLKVKLILQAWNISLLAQAIRDGQSEVATACFAPVPPAPAPLALRGRPLGGEAPPAEDVTLQFGLQPPPNELPSGTVEWTAQVYGPAGATAVVTLVASGAYGEQLALTIPGSVQGQIVLRVRFPSTTGKTVIGTPQVVLDRPPGNVLTGLALDPAVIQSQAGADVALAVTGIYDGLVSGRLFTNALNCAFQSSNASVATVDTDGRVKLLAPGTTTITATYNGTLTAMAAVTVLDVAPIVTSTESVSGTVGQLLSYQIIGSQAAQSFVAAPLPPGLTLNTQTGLINGTPTMQGATSALVSVMNANGTGSKQVDFVIVGPPGAPTDVGLDASGVSGQKPVGTLVGRLMTVDPNPLDTFTYQLVAGTGSTNNTAFSITGDQLFTAAVLNGATTSSVSIRVRTTDSTGASFEKALVLPVGTPPVVTRQPDAREVFVGESAVFFVETTGLEPLQYQWKKDGVDVTGATSRIFEVRAAALADAGNYTVTVTNGDGTVTSAPASLVVDLISYGRWVSLIPDATSGALFEPMGDYNADGIVNFLEFAFGVQPNPGLGVAALPFITRDAGGIVLTYREANRIQPLVYRILKSADLLTWAEHQPAPGDVTRIDRGSYTEVQVRIASPGASLFVKMSVGTQ